MLLLFNFFVVIPMLTRGGEVVMSVARKTIQSGGVYSIDNFISDVSVQELREFVDRMKNKGYFSPSGLSYASTSDYGLATTKITNRLVCDEIPEHYIDNPALLEIADRIDSLRYTLARVLSRPSMSDDDLAHESYISYSPAGSFLSRHMDERHEEPTAAPKVTLPKIKVQKNTERSSEHAIIRPVLRRDGRVAGRYHGFFT